MATALPTTGDQDPGPAHGSRSAARSARRASGHGQRPDIQGMRAIAVLLVVASHAEIKHILGGGYIGVDVFFVVSGFLITGLLAREVRSTGRVSFANFYAKRARRILPAASLTLLLTLLLSTLVYTDGDLSKVATDVKWAAFFAANLHFAQGGTDYFAAATFETPVQHFWSLAVEEQFYLLWPVLIALMLLPGRRTKRAASGPRATRSRIALGRTQALRRAGVLIGLLSVLSFAWSIHDTSASPQSAYFSTFTRGWELGLGSLLALTAHRVGRLPDVVKATMSWVGLTAVLFAAVVYTPATPFPGSAALVPVLGAVLILAGGVDGPRYGATMVLSLRPMRFIGDISYSVYLLHWPVLILTTAYAGGHLRIRHKLVLIALTIGLSWLCYRWVETPFRSTKRRGMHATVRSLALWPAALAMVLAPAAVIYQSTMAQSSTTASAAQKVAQKEAKKPSAVSSLRNQVESASDKAQSGHPLPAELVPSLVHLEDDKTEPSDNCWAGTREKVKHKLCPRGDTRSPTTVVVWGDSHAGQWLKPLSSLAKKNHIKLIALTKAGCMPADVYQRLKGIAYDQCDTYRKWALQQIKGLKPEAVILSGLLRTPILDRATGKEVSDSKGTELFKEGSARTLQKLRGLTNEIDVISDQSPLPDDAGNCLGTRTADLSTCAEPPNKVTVARNAAWKANAEKVGAHYINMMPWECNDDVCPIVVDGTIVYRDDQHLTTTYAERLLPVLAKKIDFKSLAG